MVKFLMNITNNHNITTYKNRKKRIIRNKEN